MLSGGKLKIPEARIEVSTRCNAHCVSCPREKMTRAKLDMSTDLFRAVVSEAVLLGAEQVDMFGYGEALLDRDFISKLAFCKRMGLDTYLTTNASVLSQGLSRALIEGGLTHIRFSFHATEPEQYEKFHRGLKWNTSVQNFLDFTRINEWHGHPCSVHIVSLAMNGEPVDSFRKVWESQCDYLEVWRPHNWAGGRSYRQVVRTKKTCGRPFNGPLQVNADGKVMVCCFDYDAQMVIGDANVDSIEHILTKSERLDRIRDAHTRGDYTGLPCDQCDQLRVYDESPLLYSTLDPSRQVGKIAVSKRSVEV